MWMNIIILVLLVTLSFIIYNLYYTNYTQTSIDSNHIFKLIFGGFYPPDQEGMDTIIESPTNRPIDPLLIIEDFLESRVLFSHSIDGIITFLTGNNNGDKYIGLIKKLQNLQLQMNNI